MDKESLLNSIETLSDGELVQLMHDIANELESRLMAQEET